MVDLSAITEERKKKGNYELKNKIYAGAIKMYETAIESCPSPVIIITPENVLRRRDNFDKKRPVNG